MGLAIYTTRARRVTDEMFLAAARALAEQVTPAELDAGLVYPPQSANFETEMQVAGRIAEVIFARGLARVKQPRNLRDFLEAQVHKVEYRNLAEDCTGVSRLILGVWRSDRFAHRPLRF